MEGNNQPFSLLPSAMVDEMLAQSKEVGDALLESFNQVNKNKEIFRGQLHSANLLGNISELPHVSAPTTAGIDGAHIVERLMATDLVTAAAVAIEGLTPPSETKYWEAPYHKVYIQPEKHGPDTPMIIRGVMWEMEIILAASAPHDIIFIDGSITNPFLNLNPAINALKGSHDSRLETQLDDRFEEFINAYHTITTSTRTDKVYVGVPKYTSKREIGSRFNWPLNFDDRAIFTSILKAGEFTIPVPYAQPEEPWHMSINKLPSYKKEQKNLLNEIIQSVSQLYVLYFRPHSYTPALRLEVSKTLSTNKYQLASLLNAVSFQCGTPGIFEPYPLFMADRIVKNLGKAIPAFRQTATRSLAEQFNDDLSEIFFNMHSYRTEM